MPGFPVVEMIGKPHRMGLAHGRVLARQIKANYAVYMDMIMANINKTEAEVIDLAKPFRPFIEEVAPELIEEMEGLAEGAGMEFDQILVLNARTELGYSDQLAAAECSSLALAPSRTENGRTLLAQNWDWLPAMKDRVALLRLTPDNGPRALIFCEAGQVSKIGLNEYGLGQLMNLLMSPGAKYGVPIHILSRLILETDSVAAAIELVQKTTRASSTNFLIGDKSGRLASLETAPETVGLVEMDNGFIAHSNHYCDPGLAKTDQTIAVLPDSPARLARLQELIGTREKWSAKTIKEVLKDHDQVPLSICRHLPQTPDMIQAETVASLIMDLDELTIQTTQGQPCRAEYRTTAMNQ